MNFIEVTNFVSNNILLSRKRKREIDDDTQNKKIKLEKFDYLADYSDLEYDEMGDNAKGCYNQEVKWQSSVEVEIN